MQKKYILLISSALLCVVLIYRDYARRSAVPAKPPYQTIQATPRDLVQCISATGTLKAVEQLVVGSLMSGRVQEILASDNDVVKKGQVLAILDNGIGNSALKQAQAVLMQAQASANFQKKFYARQKALYEAGHIAENLFDEITQTYAIAQGKLAEAEAVVEMEQKKYNDLFIKSPDDGIVIAKKIDLGQMVTSQLNAQVLFEIAKDLTSMEVHVDIDEADVGLVQQGQAARFTVDAYPKESFYSTVKQVEFLAKLVDNTISYEGILPIANPTLKLRPGMTATIDINVAEVKGALAIPNKVLRVNSLKLEQWAQATHRPYEKLGTRKKSVFKTTGHDTLWVLEDGILKQRKVTLGINDGAYTQLLSGASAHEHIISVFNEPADTASVLKGLLGGGSIGK